MIKKYYEADPKELEKLWNRMIDWLLFNLEEIDSYIDEMLYLGSGIIYGYGPPPANDSIELNIIMVDEAKSIINTVESCIKQFEQDDFDIFIDRYLDGMVYPQIAEWRGISEITVKRRIKKIRKFIRENIENNDIEIETIVRLRDKLRYVFRKKVA